MMGHLSVMLKGAASRDYGQIIVTVNCPEHLSGARLLSLIYILRLLNPSALRAAPCGPSGP